MRKNTLLTGVIVCFFGLACTQLTSGQESESVSQLSILINPSNPERQRISVLEFLKNNYNRDTLAALGEIIVNDVSLELRLRAFWALSEVAYKDPVAIPTLHETALRVSRADMPHIREQACEALPMYPDEVCIEEVLNMLMRETQMPIDLRGYPDSRDKGPDWITILIVTRLQFRGAPFVKQIESFYSHHKEGEISYCLAFVLRRLKKPIDTLKIIEGIEKTSIPRLRASLISEIGVIGDKRAVPVIKRFIDDQYETMLQGEIHYPVRTVARRVLQELEGTQIETDTH